jgi:hypothetical protein
MTSSTSSTASTTPARENALVKPTFGLLVGAAIGLELIFRNDTVSEYSLFNRVQVVLASIGLGLALVALYRTIQRRLPAEGSVMTLTLVVLGGIGVTRYATDDFSWLPIWAPFAMAMLLLPLAFLLDSQSHLRTSQRQAANAAQSAAAD